MPTATLSFEAKARAPAAALRLLLVTVLIMGFNGKAFADDNNSDKAFADQVSDFLNKNGLTGQTATSQMMITEGGAATESTPPQAPVRPQSPFEPATVQSVDAERKGRALNALDEVIKDENLRELRLP